MARRGFGRDTPRRIAGTRLSLPAEGEPHLRPGCEDCEPAVRNSPLTKFSASAHAVPTFRTQPRCVVDDTSTPPEQAVAGLRILLIHRTSEPMLMRLLARKGHDVLVVDDHQPSKWLGVFKPNLVLVAAALDVAQTCRELRSHGTEPPIVAIAPDGEIRRRVAVLESGADDCLSSPVHIEELNARIQAACRRGSQLPIPARTTNQQTSEGTA